jgi:uncharacterized protein
MDGFSLFLFSLRLPAVFVSGFSGFAMGLVVSGVWLHIIAPIQTAASAPISRSTLRLPPQ